MVAGKSSGVKGDDGCWIMDVSRLLLDSHTHTGKLFLRGSGLENPRPESGLENPRGNSMAGTRQT